MTMPALQLLLHGTIVLIVGLLAGVPYGRAITAGNSEERIRAWRVAHTGLTSGGGVMIAVAGVLSQLTAGAAIHWTIVAALAVSGYGFAVALPLGAIAGQRGLTASGPVSNRIVYCGNIIGACWFVRRDRGAIVRHDCGDHEPRLVHCHTLNLGVPLPCQCSHRWPIKARIPETTGSASGTIRIERRQTPTLPNSLISRDVVNHSIVERPEANLLSEPIRSRPARREAREQSARAGTIARNFPAQDNRKYFHMR